MLWTHEEHPGRRVRLAYCLNVHPADDVAGVLDGMRRVTLPLRDRLSTGGSFGVGPYFAAAAAERMASVDGAADLETLAAFVRDEGLDPFTFNAFPFGGFHSAGLKAEVFRPTWMEEERLAFTVAVARVAARLARDRAPASGAPGHVSISTHTGMFGAWVRGAADLKACARNMARCVLELARLEAEGAPRMVLSLEAEPRANAGDSAALFGFLAWVRVETMRFLEAEEGMDARSAGELGTRHLGTCLDCCHSAVEFEDAGEALSCATGGGPLGKLQFSSALAVRRPGEHAGARALLFDMDEPRYLHQVTSAGPGGLARCEDLPELRAAVDAGANEWLAADEWRCHFHVPVDLDEVGKGVGTTRVHAEHILAAALAAPGAWTTDELHVEIETYTWDILPGPARGPGDLVDGLEREYRHVMALLEAAGWKRAD